MEYINILSHNVFWFQGAPFPTDTPLEPDSDIMDSLCNIYKNKDAHVICLQEIQDKETFDKVSEKLDMDGYFTPGCDLPQYGGAVLWKPCIGEVITDSILSKSDAQRMWQLIKIKFHHIDFSICNIHLPSKRQLSPVKALRQSLHEINDVLGAIQDGPDIIAGDFNEYYGDDGPVGNTLLNNQYSDSAALTCQNDISTNKGGKRGDYIWLNGAMRKRLFQYGVISKSDLFCKNADKDLLSDHYPLWAKIQGDL